MRRVVVGCVVTALCAPGVLVTPAAAGPGPDAGFGRAGGELSAQGHEGGACGEFDGPLPAQTRTKHFFIQYDPAELTRPVTEYKRGLEKVFRSVVRRYGWPKPPFDDANPLPGGRYHVRIEETSPAAGITAGSGAHAGFVRDNPHTRWEESDAVASCLILSDDLSSAGSIRHLVGHEFMHMVHLGIGVNDLDFAVKEGSAQWLGEDATRSPGIPFLWPHFDRSLGEYGTTDKALRYWIMFQGLVERFRPRKPGGAEQTMQIFYERMSRKPGERTLIALHKALRKRRVNLPEAFHDYAVAAKFVRACGGGYTLPHCFADADDYVGIGDGRPPTHDQIQSQARTDSSVPDDYAVKWIALPATGKPYDVKVKNRSQRGRLRATVVCNTGDRLDLHGVKGRTVDPGRARKARRIRPRDCEGVVLVVTSEPKNPKDPRAADPDHSPDIDFRVTTLRRGRKATLTATTAGRGRGRVVTPDGKVRCGSKCTRNYRRTQTVTLRARTGKGSRFAGWSGACSGRSKTCTVKMKKARAVHAQFEDTRAPKVRRPRKVRDKPNGKFVVRWPKAKDAKGSGVTKYRIQRRKNKGAWKGWKRRPEGRRVVKFRPQSGVRYCFRVRAIDLAKNRSDYSHKRCRQA